MMAIENIRKSFFARVRGWYAKIERPFSSISLIGGFVFDALTLKRVDLFWENFWVVIHLVIVGLCILIINRIGADEADADNPDKADFWLVNVMQFFFGGLLSTFLVFYFRSGNLFVSWPFYLLLIAAFAANERLKKHYARISFQISLFFLSLFSFSIYLTPIVLHSLGAFTFLMSGAVALAILWLFLIFLRLTTRKNLKPARRIVLASVLGIFTAMNALYFLNFIPPIPLSLKDADIYTTFAVNGPGDYTAGHEDQGRFSFFKLSDDIHLVPGNPLIAYSAVFSPTALNVGIIHEWQYFEPVSGAWITKSRVPLSVYGGRDGGYKTYSVKYGILPGKWRVNIQTARGAILGRLDFNVISANTAPSLQTVNIN